MVYIDKDLKEIYVKDMRIIKEELTPFMLELEKKEVDIFSLAMFFSSYVSELLKEIDDKNIKEIILRRMMD